jgi:hypothetical protein
MNFFQLDNFFFNFSKNTEINDSGSKNFENWLKDGQAAALKLNFN